MLRDCYEYRGLNSSNKPPCSFDTPIMSSLAQNDILLFRDLRELSDAQYEDFENALCQRREVAREKQHQADKSVFSIPSSTFILISVLLHDRYYVNHRGPISLQRRPLLWYGQGTNTDTKSCSQNTTLTPGPVFLCPTPHQHSTILDDQLFTPGSTFSRTGWCCADCRNRRLHHHGCVLRHIKHNY